MTQQEILEYNKRCAEFLGWYYENNKWLKLESLKSGVIAVLKCNSDFDLKFHSDWNWIMEVVAKIQLLDIVHDYSRGYDNVYKEWTCSFTPAYKTHDFGYILGISKNSEMEAVVQVINQFLIWHGTCKKSSHA